MSDPKNPEDDIIAEAPEDISDAALDDVEGGFSRFTTVTASLARDTSMTITGQTSDTVFAGTGNDTILASGDFMQSTTLKFTR